MKITEFRSYGQPSLESSWANSYTWAVLEDGTEIYFDKRLLEEGDKPLFRYPLIDSRHLVNPRFDDPDKAIARAVELEFRAYAQHHRREVIEQPGRDWAANPVTPFAFTRDIPL